MLRDRVDSCKEESILGSKAGTVPPSARGHFHSGLVRCSGRIAKSVVLAFVGVMCAASFGRVMLFGDDVADKTPIKLPASFVNAHGKVLFKLSEDGGFQVFDNNAKPVAEFGRNGIVFYGDRPIKYYQNVGDTEPYAEFGSDGIRFRKNGELGGFELGELRTYPFLRMGATTLFDDKNGSMLWCSQNSLRLVDSVNTKHLATFRASDKDLILGNPDPEAPGIGKRLSTTESDISDIKKKLMIR